MLKKLIILSSLFLLAGCGADYEPVPVDYLNVNRNQVIENVLGDKLSKELAQEQFDDQVIELYYNELSEGAYDIQVWNESNYYYSGEVFFPECNKSISVTAVPPKTGIITTMVCPEFDVEADFEFNGDLYERKAEKQLGFTYEGYYYEDYPNVYEYVLNVPEASETMMKQFMEYLYEELVLENFDSPATIYIYTQESYQLDTYEEACKGLLWIDPVNDIAEMSDIDGNLIERVNYR